MITDYLQLIGLTLIGGILSLVGGIWLLRSKKSAESLALYATPFAAGALLSAVFLDLLKDGINHGDADTVLSATLVGILIFFLAERLLRWFHHHHDEDDPRANTAPLIIAGDTAHNALDGVAIAAGFLISPATGLVTAIAVAAHEIPQEIGDFGLLLSKGMSRGKVLLANALSALATTVFAVVAFALGSAELLPIDLMLGISAGFLLYIALSDIIPSIHATSPKKRLMDWRALLLLAGVVVVGLVINIAHDYIDNGHVDDNIHSEQIEIQDDDRHDEYNDEDNDH